MSELLDAIYANPDDDAARAVYADWLQEQGDPRGEFIALQLMPAGKRDRRAEQALINQHKKTWLGPLATVLMGDVEFERGFPVKGTGRFRDQREAEQLGSVREWATIEDLAFHSSGSRDDQERWTRYLHPAMTGLRVVRFPDSRWLDPAPRPWRIEELWVDVLDKTAFQTLCSFPTLPSLRTLVVRGMEPAYLDDVARVAPQLSVIDGYALRDDKRRRTWFAALAKQPIERFTVLWLGAGELHNHFTRDEHQNFTRLEIEIRHPKHDEPTEYEIREIAGELERLPEGSLTHFEAHFVRDGQSRPIPDLVRAAQRLLPR